MKHVCIYGGSCILQKHFSENVFLTSLVKVLCMVRSQKLCEIVVTLIFFFFFKHLVLKAFVCVYYIHI